jgi:hypothetical protein
METLKHPKLVLRYIILFISLIALTQIIPALLNGGGFAILFAVILFILSIGYGIPYISRLIEITKTINNQNKNN